MATALLLVTPEPRARCLVTTSSQPLHSLPSNYKLHQHQQVTNTLGPPKKAAKMMRPWRQKKHLFPSSAEDKTHKEDALRKQTPFGLR